MKKLFLLLALSSVICLQISAQLPELSPSDTSICGGSIIEYELDPVPIEDDFKKYSWTVTGGTFTNGLTTYEHTNYDDATATVNWSTEPDGEFGKLRLVVVKYTALNNYETEYEPRVIGVATPDQVVEAPSGTLTLPVGSMSKKLTITDNQDWYVDWYRWFFDATVGDDEPHTTNGNDKDVWFSFAALEYGTISIYSDNDDCDIESTPIYVTLNRKLDTPDWYSPNGYDEVMCTSTTSIFRIDPVPSAETYYWEATGGYTIWNGSSYVSSTTTTGTSVTVKARSSSGGGSISVTAKHSYVGVLDSETLSQDLWSGTPLITNKKVDGYYYYPGYQICPGDHWLSGTPEGAEGGTITWTVPYGIVYFAGTNTLDFTFPSSMSSVAITAYASNSCGTGTNSSFYLTKKTWGCGGYYMAAPNPAEYYTKIDIASDDDKAQETSYNSDITLTVLDKMGTQMMKVNVESLPYILDTSKLPKGEYIIQIVSQPKDKEPLVDALKIIVNQ